MDKQQEYPTLLECGKTALVIGILVVGFLFGARWMLHAFETPEEHAAHSHHSGKTHELPQHQGKR
jgi:hypothetical protein